LHDFHPDISSADHYKSLFAWFAGANIGFFWGAGFICIEGFSLTLAPMKVLLIISGMLLLGVIALAVHVYVVTHGRVDAHSRGMARIDLHQKIGREDADRIKVWLSRQNGVDHVLVNPGTAIAVFTYWPTKANPGLIIRTFRDSLSYSRAERYLPTAAEVQKGCPMKVTPVTNKIYEFLKHFF
jgi:hypothetical protein